MLSAPHRRPHRRLIVTADDFGLSPGVNQAVIQAHQQGILTCASLMVNEPGCEQAVALARANPRLGVGLHLTLLDGRSALPPERVPGLVDPHQRFTTSPFLAGCRYLLRPSLKRQLRAEIAAQFQKFRATGLALDHVNSHHHLHAHPVIFHLLVEAAAELGLERLRLPYEPGFGVHPFLLFHKLMAARARPRLRQAGLKHNDFLFGLKHTGRVDEACLAKLLPALPAGVSELYSHPSAAAAHELQALLSDNVRALIKAHGIELIRFSDL